MRRRQQTTEAEDSKVPAYIVTFSDMVTLLLTFFVMLLTLATIQDPELFNTGRDSFLKSVQSFGLGMLLGKKVALDFGEYKVKYFISNPDEFSKARSIDAKEENVRRLFKNVTQSMTSTPSQIVAQKTNFSVADISFSAGEASLNEPAKKFLTRFSLDLQANNSPKTIKLYVLGLARDVKGEKEQWMLSAKRAQAVSDFLYSILTTELQWPVYSWGAGPGGLWVDKNSPASKQSQILIAVLRANN
jgi:chemotaxis protein MotB